MSWTHDALQRDLADHLSASRDRFIWEDMQMGPAGSPRPDVYTLNKSYSNPKPLTYEIKISKADLRSDLTKGKWQSYLDFSSGVIFAVPAGLMSKKDLPAGCGLIVRHENVWRTAKAPTLNPVKLSQKMMLKMIIDGISRERSVNTLKSKDVVWPSKKARQQLSDEVVSAVLDLQAVKRSCKYRTEKAEEKAERIVSEAAARAERAQQETYRELREIARIVGIDFEADGCTPIDLAYKLREIRSALSKDEMLKRALRSLSYAHKNIGHLMGDFESMLQARTQEASDA